MLHCKFQNGALVIGRYEETNALYMTSFVAIYNGVFRLLTLNDFTYYNMTIHTILMAARVHRESSQ